MIGFVVLYVWLWSCGEPWQIGVWGMGVGGGREVALGRRWDTGVVDIWGTCSGGTVQGVGGVGMQGGDM